MGPLDLVARMASLFDEHGILEFYLPSAAAAVALAENGSFNVIHNETAFKVDLFVLGDSPLDRAQLARRLRLADELSLARQESADGSS